MNRASGLLLPVASLPSVSPIGDLGTGAERWIEFLRAAGQKYWAIIPLLIPDSVGSPYASPSAFAGNWQMVSPEQLARNGFIRGRTSAPVLGHQRVTYQAANIHGRKLLGQAWQRFLDQAPDRLHESFVAYQRNEAGWLSDYALYMAIKDRQGGKPWHAWPKALRDRQPGVLRTFQRVYQPEIDFFAFGQWLFDQQWRRIRRLANANGIRIIGDFAYSVAHDNVDVWRHRQFFQLHANGALGRVIGAPPDELNRSGQNWGLSAYNWDALRADRFDWWVRRMRRALVWCDLVRLDHFRGYRAVWELPSPGAPGSAGAWHPVPGDALLARLHHELRRVPAIAEDLGVITDDVIALRSKFRLPGMRVLQFGWSEDRPTFHHPAQYPKNSVAFSSTHDLPTLADWLSIAPPADVRRALQYSRKAPGSRTQKLLTVGMASPSRLFIAQAQDVFGLGARARVNQPGTTTGNWSWRLPAQLLTRTNARALLALTRQTGR